MVRHILFAIFSVAVLVLLGAFAYREETVEWKDYQRAYYQKLAKFTNDPKVANTPLRIKQIWNTELGHADRCTTCHLGIDNPKFAKEKQPLTTHPFFINAKGERGYIFYHTFDKFGCTICHNGDGQATSVDRTHGVVEHLDFQLLSGSYVQSSCTKCHVELYSREVYWPETPILMKGKELASRLGCGACHSIRQLGTSATLAPELSGLGSKTELAFYLVHDYSHIEGEHHITRQWEFEHFKDPQKIVPGNPTAADPKDRTGPTIMPNWGLTDEEAEALTVFVLSLKDPKSEKIPLSYLPRIKGHEDYFQYRQ
jgi:cytochrome c2